MNINDAGTVGSLAQLYCLHAFSSSDSLNKNKYLVYVLPFPYQHARNVQSRLNEGIHVRLAT